MGSGKVEASKSTSAGTDSFLCPLRLLWLYGFYDLTLVAHKNTMRGYWDPMSPSKVAFDRAPQSLSAAIAWHLGLCNLVNSQHNTFTFIPNLPLLVWPSSAGLQGSLDIGFGRCL